MAERRNDLYPKAYGEWAGNNAGRKPDFALCCEEVRGDGRFPLYHQCRRPRGYGPDEAYCKQHDPAAKEARRLKAEADYGAKNYVEMKRDYGHQFLGELYI